VYSGVVRASQRCPKCHGENLYVCENHQPDEDCSNLTHPFRVTAVQLSTEETGGKHGTSHRTHVGTYETWICAACGYTEWYAVDKEGLLERLAKIRNSGVRLVRPPAKPPYR